jgi:hypothetical protein
MVFRGKVRGGVSLRSCRMVFRGKVRGGVADVAFGRVRLPVIAEVTAELACRSRRCVARSRTPRVPVGTAGAANPGRASSGGRDPIRPNGHHIGALATGY